jgi:hypothetical protein
VIFFQNLSNENFKNGGYLMKNFGLSPCGTELDQTKPIEWLSEFETKF